MTKIVEVPTIKVPIQASPGFQKKKLADYKLDACGLCQYGCVYCSSNNGNYLRMRRGEFGDLTEEQTGTRTLPAEDPHLMFVWPDYVENLRSQLQGKPRSWGSGKTLIYSMLTDGFSPHLVKSGITEDGLRLVLENTKFRIRILTKNAIVGSSKWIRFFSEEPDRFVVGLSIGTLDDDWARQVERLASVPSKRVEALRSLQDAGVATYGMLCPVFPDVLQADRLEGLVDAIRPHRCEHVWAEPYNDRVNWRKVRDALPADSASVRWLDDVFASRNLGQWSAYATELYTRIHARAVSGGWSEKLRYLLYEGAITDEDAHHFAGLDGVLLQSKLGEGGLSANSAIAALQV